MARPAVQHSTHRSGWGVQGGASSPLVEAPQGAGSRSFSVKQSAGAGGRVAVNVAFGPTFAPFPPTQGRCLAFGVHSLREPHLLRSVREAAQRAGSLEDALRAALQQICAATGWQAGRVEFSEEAGELSSHIVWHLERPERLGTLRRIAERRRRTHGSGLAGQVLREGAPQWRPDPEEGAAAVFAFPAVAHHKTLAAVEFFAGGADPPDDVLLSGIARACAELGRVIEQKPAGDALRRVEHSYRELFETVAEAMMVIDPRSGLILDANPRAAGLYGIAREHLVGAGAHQLWSDAALARAAIARGRRFETVLSGPERDVV